MQHFAFLSVTLMACLSGMDATSEPHKIHFYCQFWTDLTTRCWWPYHRERLPDDTVHDKALNVSAGGVQYDRQIWSNSDGIFEIDSTAVAAHPQSARHYGSCTFDWQTAACAYVLPEPCEPCLGRQFKLQSYWGQPQWSNGIKGTKASGTANDAT